MKKKFLVTLLTIIFSLCAPLLASCDSLPTYSVFYITGEEVYWQTVTFGNEQLLLPDEPTKEGFVFSGWYIDPGVYENQFSSDYLVDVELDSDLVVFAYFTPSHTHQFTTQTTLPTCTVKGFTTYTCECGESYVGDIVDALGHVEVDLPSVNPSCFSGGLSDGKYCSTCNEILVSQAYVPVLGHDFGDFVSNNDATESSNGTKTATCQREGCGETLTVTDEGTMLEPANRVLIYFVDGEELQREQLVNGAQIEVPVPVKEGEVFDGWYIDEGRWQNPFTPLYLEGQGLPNEITVYAKFNATHAHEYATSITPPDCLNAGFTAHFCPCGFYYADQFVSALGHTAVIDEAVEATCAVPGLTEGSHCATCEQVLIAQNQIVVAHTSVLLPEALATCTENGLTYGYKCSVCEQVLTEQQVVEATGHSFTEHVVLPTCDSMGSAVKVCSCGYSETATQEALGHLFTTYVSNGDATIYKDGTKTAVCDREGCDATQVLTDEGSKLSPSQSVTISVNFYADGSEYEIIQTLNDVTLTMPTAPTKEGEAFDGWYIDDGEFTQPFYFNYLLLNAPLTDVNVYAKFSLEHTHAYADFITAPTCVEQGYTTHACVCGDFSLDTFTLATGHDEQIIAYVAPTCTEVGYTQGVTCANCGQALVARQALEATGHRKVIVEGYLPTCTAKGLTQGIYCSVCNQTLVEQIELEATGHNFAVASKLEANCVDDGHTVYLCACGDYYTTVESALGHSFTNYVSDQNATYQADGTKTAVCDREGCEEKDTLVDEGSILIHYHSYSAIVYDSTCTEEGYTKHVCSCGDYYIDAYTEILPHSFTNYLSNGNGTMTAVCDRRGCSATDVNYDETPTIIDKIGYLEDFGSEMREDSIQHQSTQADGSVKTTYTENKYVVESRIFLSSVGLPIGNYTATFNGESIGEITVDYNKEATLGYLPSNLTLGQTYTLSCVSEGGKIYEQQFTYVSRAIDSGEELLRAVTYYNQYLDQSGNYSYQYNVSPSSFRSQYIDSRQYYNGATFSQRYYVLTTDITVTNDLVSYGVGGTYDVRNPHCDLYRQHFSYWFDYIDGQGHTISIERFVDGGVFGHVGQNAVIKNLCISPISTWWNQIAVTTKVVLGMSISSNATIENVVLSVNLEVTLGGINALATKIYEDAILKNIYIYIPSTVTFAQTENTANFMLNSGYIGSYLRTTNIQNVVVLSPNFKHAGVTAAGAYIGANNQEYDDYVESCYYFSDADFLLNSGRGSVGPWHISSDGSAKYYAQLAS